MQDQISQETQNARLSAAGVSASSLPPNQPNQQPAAQAPATSAPQMATPTAPQAQTTPGAPNSAQNAPTSPTTTQTQQSAPPQTNLQQGATGQNVSQLQDYLVQQGYPIDFSNGGHGTYGPQTTSAVAKMQQDLGINPGSAAGMYGPQTQQALAQKYQNIFASKSGTTVPQGGSDARNAIQGSLNQADTSQNPVLGAMAGAMAPIMQSLTQVLSNINNPALSAVSLQSEYNTLREQYQLPEMNSQLMNMNRIMNGTLDDVRDEVTKAGGFTTESQVQGIAAARNKVIQKQYNALSTQYDAAQQNVQAQMQYAQNDKSNALQRAQATAGVTESMASIQTQLMQLGLTMTNQARSAVQYNVTQMGYQGLASQVKGNPQLAGYYENMLALAPGTLSDPNKVAGMDTYKDQGLAIKSQQLEINNYRAAIAAYGAGYGGSPGGGGTMPSIPGMTGGQVGVTPVDPTTLVRPPSVGLNTQLRMSADDMQTYMTQRKDAHLDPGTQNVVATGIGYYLHQADGSYVLKSALPSPIQSQYNDIKQTINAAPVFQGSPAVTRKWTLSANSAISSFKDTGTYKIASNVAPYLAAIHAAAVNPGDKSISDFELLDSFVKAAKGGTGQVTDSQIGVMLNGASLGDNMAKLSQKLQSGGVLAPAQRQALVNLADETYKRNMSDYQKVYVQAINGMHSQGIPPNFWSNMPDFSSLSQ